MFDQPSWFNALRARAKHENSYCLSAARVSGALLPENASYRLDPDGFALVDLTVEKGRITTLRPHEAERGDTVSLNGSLVWPCFTDLHAHLDKGHIWPRVRNPDGTHGGAARSVAADRQASWKAEDVRARFSFGLRCAYAYGTAAIRTHIDSYELSQARVSWRVFDELSEEWKGRIHLQGVVMARLGQYVGQEGEELATLARNGSNCLGGILKITPENNERTDAAVNRGLDRLFELAATFGLDVDLHVDETSDTQASGLRAVARAVKRKHFKGVVTCGHCCALALQESAIVEETITLLQETGIIVVCLPTANNYLQDRVAGRTPRWRGITPALELDRAGIPVVVASDNCRDPFYPFGDHDMVDVLRDFARIAHVEMAIGHWATSVTSRPAKVMGNAAAIGVAPGSIADLVVFSGRSVSEWLARPGSARAVLRGGQLSDARVPEYQELDNLYTFETCKKSLVGG